MIYKPDSWQMLLINNEIVKVFACWRGGYASGDSWRCNSGCTKIVEKEEGYLVNGYSGSAYVLIKGANRLSSYGNTILAEIIGELGSYGHTVKIISIEEAIKFLEENK